MSTGLTKYTRIKLDDAENPGKITHEEPAAVGNEILHTAAPKALGINKILTLSFIGICVLILAGAFVFGIGSSKNTAENAKNITGSHVNNAAVGQLPDSYQELAKYNKPQQKSQDEDKPADAKQAPVVPYTPAYNPPAANPDRPGDYRRSPVRFNVGSPYDGEPGMRVAGAKSSGSYVEAEIQEPVSPYMLQAGTVIPSTLITGINSDLSGPVVAQVRENVFDSITGQYLLIPQGTRVIGDCGGGKTDYGQKRVSVVWQRMIFPNGDSIDLGGMPGTDNAGYPGLSDRVNNHGGKLARGVMLASILSAGAQIAAGNTSIEHQSTGQLATSAASQNLMNTASGIINRDLNLSPTLEIRPGYKFNVFVTKDLVLEPYAA